ncbi:unnamed protein product [Caenorhabditis bovis]|uniref:Protein kinase domain-containing protein n=1 Tax=Caenorhabditis bovis TaxID=2654633 RepID=A0A8S1FC08_9PELO|nr:unnamed protein product [Caenorhabditis bovis]
MQIALALLLALVFGSPTALILEHCDERALGLASGRITDAQITASSSFDKQSVGPQNARLHSELASGAWCPKPQINSKSYEYLQINLNSTFLITAIETQGRYGNGTGQEFASEYMIDYLRPGCQWMRYTNRTGHMLMTGNFDTVTVVRRALDPPIVASKIRIVPMSKVTRTVCLRADLRGCEHHGIIYYSTAPEGSRLNDLDFKDTIFENSQLLTESGIRRGLGLLTDGYVAHSSPFEKSQKNASWIGWHKNSASGVVRILFEFGELHNFTDVTLATYGNRVNQINVIFSQDGTNFPLHTEITSSEPISSNSTSRMYYFRVPLHHRCGIKVRMTIKFSSEWMFLTEVHFNSTSNITSSTIKVAVPPSTENKKMMVLGGVIFLTLLSCVALCVTMFLRRRKYSEKNCDQNLKKDLIITHMGNKPTCHVFPSNKISRAPYEMANDIYFAKSQKSTLLSVSSKSTSSYRPLPPTWSEFNFPPPPPAPLIKEEPVYSQPLSPGSNSSMRRTPISYDIKTYPSSSLMIGKTIGEGKFTYIKECIIFGGVKVAHKSTKEPNCIHGRRALKDEFAMLTKCGKHPRVVELMAIDEHLNLLLEHIELGNINVFMQTTPTPLDIDFLLSICSDVCEGMAHLEQLGIVHGHLTTNNILLTNDFRAKICSPRGPAHHAQLRYSAPECIVANEFTHKSDVWSFAVCVWEMSYQCRLRPFEQLSNEQIVDNACALLENRPNTVTLEYPPIFNNDLRRCLNQSFNVNRVDRPTFEKLMKLLS